MIKISEIVYEIIQGDEIALETLRMGLLNLSAYAQKIQPQISKRLYKTVSKGTIVTSLSRMKSRLTDVPSLFSEVKIKDMSIKSPLVEISYEKTAKLIKQASKLELKTLDNYYAIVYGVGEISLIIQQNLKKIIINHFRTKPKNISSNLVAITVRFNKEEYLQIPNVIYTLLGALARQRINIIEIVSTFTEISFIVKDKDMKRTVDALKYFFYQSD